MIHIEKDQIVPDNTNLRVLSITGDYSDNDLIECYGADDPTLAVASFQAQFIKYGGLVYRYNSPEELGAAIAEIDPDSTHDSAILYKEDEERRQKRMNGNLVPQNQVPADEAVSPIAQEAALQENTSQEEPEIGSGNTTPETVETPPTENTPVLTTDPIVVPPTVEFPAETNNTTTTPDIISSPAPTTVTTSTPDIIENASTVIDTISTTTEKVSNIIEAILDTSASTTTTP